MEGKRKGCIGEVRSAENVHEIDKMEARVVKISLQIEGPKAAEMLSARSCHTGWEEAGRG
jgi:hypothetical protein